MSLANSLAGVARTLIGPQGLAGVTVTFTRISAEQFDEISGMVGPETRLTWTASALEVASTIATSRQPGPTAQRLTSRTFRVPGQGVAEPQPGDMLTVGGVVLRVIEVTTLRPDASGAVLYTVECAA